MSVKKYSKWAKAFSDLKTPESNKRISEHGTKAEAMKRVKKSKNEGNYTAWYKGKK